MDYDKINGYLVDIFNNVVIIEEASLKNSKFNDISLKESIPLMLLVHIQIRHQVQLLESLC